MSDASDRNGGTRSTGDEFGTMLVVHDASADTDALPPPPGIEIVGRVTHWNQSPSFSDVAVLMQPDCEVKPGQFLGVWHGRRNRHVVTVVQVGNSFEVNPNESPDLSAARQALGLCAGTRKKENPPGYSGWWNARPPKISTFVRKMEPGLQWVADERQRRLCVPETLLFSCPRT